MARSSHPLFSTLSFPAPQKMRRVSTKIKEFVPKQAGGQLRPHMVPSETGPSGKIAGNVKWFDVKKGYGFIRSDAVGDVDIFVHQRDIHADGVRLLLPGEKVEFQLEREADGRFRALLVTGPNGNFVYGAENVNRIRSGRFRQEGEDHPAPFWYGPANTQAFDSEHRQMPYPIFPTPQPTSNVYWNPIPPTQPPAVPPVHPAWGASMGSVVMPPYAEYVPYIVRPPYLVDDTVLQTQTTTTIQRKPIGTSQGPPTETSSALLRPLEGVELRDLESKLTPQSCRGTPVKHKAEGTDDTPRSPPDIQRKGRVSSGVKTILSGIDKDVPLKTDSITGSWRRASVPGTLDVSPPSTNSEVQSTPSTASPATSVASSSIGTPVSTSTPESTRSESLSTDSSQSQTPPSLIRRSPVVSVSHTGQGERGKVLALPLKASERGVYLKKGKQSQKRWEKKLKSAQDTVKENPDSTVWVLNDGVFSLGDDARLLREMGFTHIVWIPE